MTYFVIFLLFLMVIAQAATLGYGGYRFLQQHTKLRKLESDFAAQKARNQTIVNQYNEQQAKWQSYTQALKAEVQRLAKWKTVADADAKAQELIKAGQAELERANQQAAQIVVDATAHAETVRLDSQCQSQQIIESANAKAQAIAAEAFEAKRNASLYEQTARAMENVIKGYGDEYIIPEESLLDGLAEEFGHTEAGQELKKAREHTKHLICEGKAATCEYSEEKRRNTAITFVIDAFNGKVDSILSRVKYDNAGKLQQEIRDAFLLVNYNGGAFRSARIADEYLESRFDELKWGSVAQQLALKQREEQRRIKEQAREEEKVRRECERAMRDAAKQEDLLRNAMEKAKAQMEAAGAEQRAKYEQQLQLLTDKLTEAEERNKRAMSMAQQTKQGHVYIISNIGSFGEDVYKIGLTRRLDPLERVRELGDASVPFAFDVHALVFSEDAPTLERELHKHFVMGQMNKINHRKEFFRANLKHIREELEKIGIHATWTMTAAAKEYRETLALERAIQDDPAMREAWAKRQLDLEQTDILRGGASQLDDQDEAGEDDMSSQPMLATAVGADAL